MLVAGLISGTSADGIDVAVVRIRGSGWRTRLRLEAFHTVPYPRRVRRAVLAACDARRISTAEISQLNFLVGELFARALLESCRRAGIRPGSLDLVGSHGQTIYHQGRRGDCHGFRVASTLQIGEPSVIAVRASVTTVADFRPADMAAGGEGAPLVPCLDYLLYRHRRRTRAALNIGGIANVTVIPAQESKARRTLDGAGAGPERILAFDTGPGNMVVDALVERFSGGRMRFDRDGRWAARGRVSEKLLARLLRAPFFRRRPPKTAGREQYGREYVAALLRERLPPEDLLATATALTADSIASALRRFSPEPVEELVVSGGGAHNLFMMERLRSRLPGVRFLKADDFGIPGDAKEAVLFALLAYETYHRRPANIPSATGAQGPAILGKVIYASGRR